ncbi:hypothetical protein EON81_21950 [bacterium]|nr:MAG: hypothetical protein EON81_21950 [bacterium]
MLTAALILSIRQEPSALDRAVADSNAALKATPGVICAYKMTANGGEAKNLQAIFRFWRDGKNERVEFTFNGDTMLKRIASKDRKIAVFPTQKAYWETDASAPDGEPGADEPIEENRLKFSFSQGMELDLKSNPSFRVLSDAIETRDGMELRKITFEAVKASGTGSVKGVAEFDAKKKYFIQAKLDIVGDNPSKMELIRETFELKAPEASVFSIDPKEYEGFQKVDPPGGN